MTERKFKVIKGGINVATEEKEKRFVSAFATDTRLMGVVVLYAHWELEDDDYSPDFHQFFYFDAEEFGLESYKSLVGDDIAALTLIEQALLGGLGGNKTELNEMELRFLLCHFASINQKLALKLPEGKNEYQFLLDESKLEDMATSEKRAAIKKICAPIVSDYQLINYYLMRIFAKDEEGAEYLVTGYDIFPEIEEVKPCTLCKNSIDEFVDEHGSSYLCESLIECDKKYKIILTEIFVTELKIAKVIKRKSFTVSSAEAAMMLNRPEFVTIYEILTDPEDFELQFSAFSNASLQTMHENGKLSLQFKKNNDHVNKQVFRLNDDIHGLFYITDMGQFVLAAYSLSAIHELENSLRKTSLDRYLLPTAKYEFKEPILYEFIQSDFDDFTDFIESLSDDFDD